VVLDRRHARQALTDGRRFSAAKRTQVQREQRIESGDVFAPRTRGVPVQDIRLVLCHHHVATTQTYLADNPLRVHDRMRTFTIG
jgi:hypothetical protein